MCFLGVKGVVDVLAGVEQGLDVFLVSRASMTCLLVWSRVLMAVFVAMGRLMGFFRGFSAVFALLRVVPELSAIFWSPR